jgi:hypothetical protein
MTDGTLDPSAIAQTLGRIAGIVWPDANIPCGIQTTLFTRPREGLRLMLLHEDCRAAPMDRLLALLDSVPEDFELPTQGLNEEQREGFWEGFRSSTEE